MYFLYFSPQGMNYQSQLQNLVPGSAVRMPTNNRQRVACTITKWMNCQLFKQRQFIDTIKLRWSIEKDLHKGLANVPAWMRACLSLASGLPVRLNVLEPMRVYLNYKPERPSDRPNLKSVFGARIFATSGTYVA